MTVQNWCDGKGLAIDVAVTSPFSAQHPANKPPCEYYAEQYKHRKYEKDFKGQQLFLFSAVVWETTGAVNAEGEEVLRSYAIRIKETRSRAQLVLRAPMGPPVDLPPERGCQDDSVANR